MKRSTALFGLVLALGASSSVSAAGAKVPSENVSRVQLLACAIGFRSVCPPSNATSNSPVIINK
jgi:hypothetical protein